MRNLVVHQDARYELADGDDVLLIKDLKLKGSSEVLKKGTKFKGIRLLAAITTWIVAKLC